MTRNGVVVDFTYINGIPATISFNGNTFYYVVNGQGDVTGITDSSGNILITYYYDAWGSPYCTYNSATSPYAQSLFDLNPFRYRGYVYDWEVGLYYLQSRYYIPDVARFLNPDSYSSTGQGVLGNNMFAYSLNNPVNMWDETGCLASWINLAVKAIKTVITVAENLFTVQYDVPLYDQGSLSLCWAYCQAMVEDFQSNTVRSQDEADERARELAIEGNGPDNWNRGNWPTNCAEYKVDGTPIAATGIDSLGGLYVQMRIGGPLYAYYARATGGAHLVVVTGVNLLRGVVYTNNPWGVAGEQTYEEFLNGFAAGPSDGSYPFRYYIIVVD